MIAQGEAERLKGAERNPGFTAHKKAISGHILKAISGHILILKLHMRLLSLIRLFILK